MRILGRQKNFFQEDLQNINLFSPKQQILQQLQEHQILLLTKTQTSIPILLDPSEQTLKRQLASINTERHCLWILISYQNILLLYLLFLLLCWFLLLELNLKLFRCDSKTFINPFRLLLLKHIVESSLDLLNLLFSCILRLLCLFIWMNMLR